MKQRFLKALLGLLMIPFCLGFTWQLGRSVISTPFKADLPYLFLAGCLAYVAVHFLFKKPVLSYVFGHELTHALFAVLFGGGVKAFHATERGGQVTVTKSNFLITLAPYFFPLYAFVVIILYLVFDTSGVTAAARPLMFLLGAAFAFHLVLTIVFLQADQKDIREEGAFFSFPLIYLFNVMFTAIILCALLAQKNGILDYFQNAILHSMHIFTVLFSALYDFIARRI